MPHGIQPIFYSLRFRKIYIQVIICLGHDAVCGTAITARRVFRLLLLPLSNYFPIRTLPICSWDMIRISSLRWDVPSIKVSCSLLPASMTKNMQCNLFLSAILLSASERKRIRWSFRGKVKTIRKNPPHSHVNTLYTHALAMVVSTTVHQSARRPIPSKQNRDSFIPLK